MLKGDFFQWKHIPLYLALLLFFQAKAQDKVSNYVVVGAFEFEDNAREWVKFTRSKSYNPIYRKNFNNNLFYVIVLQSDDWDYAVTKLREVWATTYFPDAWVYTGNFGKEYIPLADRTEIASDISIEQMEEDDETLPVLQASATGLQNPAKDDNAGKSVEILREENKKVPSPIEKKNNDGVINLADFNVFFNLYHEQKRTNVEGEIKIIDTERSRLLQTVKGGEYVSILNPNNGSGKLSLVVETFGYRKMQYDINYDQPFADTSSVNVEIKGDVIVYNFPLVRYHKGDIVTMYNVYFFKDAAIMRPESRYEVLSLLEMMEENPNYKIKIHGHTNGNNMGKIIYAGDDQDYFALTEDDKQGFGSAKKLSEERSVIIRDYLLAKGISADRMEVKAWGGKKMIYDKMSNLAKQNVRVEIEILEE